MKIYFDTKYKTFLRALSAFSVSAEQLELCFIGVKRLAVKDKLNYDRNLLIFGKLCKLQAMKTGADILTMPYAIIHGPEDREYKRLRRFRRWLDARRLAYMNYRFMNMATADALRFVQKVRDDMEYIVAAFDAIKYKPSAEEVKAGINESSGSLHGVADWYARRMGISDVEQVYLLPWTRIYAALKIDVKDINFKRRLSRVIEHKNKT